MVDDVARLDLGVERPGLVIGAGSSVMYSMPAFRFQGNVTGKVAMKSRDT